MRSFNVTLLVTSLIAVGSIFLLTSNTSHNKKLRHVVAFKFKPEVSIEQMQRITTDFHALKSKIPQILEFEGGPDLSFQAKNGKFTHSFMVTVVDQKALATYGNHPDHKAFSKSADPLLAEVMVVDYWTE